MTTTAIRFFWNGFKVAGSKKLIRCYLSFNKPGNYGKLSTACVAVYVRDYVDLPAAVRDAFKVENNSDSMTDYFEKDRFVVTPASPYWAAVLAAVAAAQEQAIKRMERRQAKQYSAYRAGEITGTERDIATIRAEMAKVATKEAA